jgi:hypothetical protein
MHKTLYFSSKTRCRTAVTDQCAGPNPSRASHIHRPQYYSLNVFTYLTLDIVNCTYSTQRMNQRLRLLDLLRNINHTTIDSTTICALDRTLLLLNNILHNQPKNNI